MRRKMTLAIAMFVLVSLIFTACTGNNPSESAPPPSPQPTLFVDEAPDTEDPPESPQPQQLTPTALPSEQAGTATEDIKARMAGFWRMDWPNPANAEIMILFSDGTWESPGPLPTDYIMSGVFDIASEESGIYHLRLTVEHTTSPYIDVGSELINDYFYDVQNDLLFTVLSSGAGDSTVGFIRE